MKNTPDLQPLEKTISVAEPEPKSVGLDPVSSLQTVSERDESSIYSDFDSDEEIEVVDRGTWTLPKGKNGGNSRSNFYGPFYLTAKLS